MSALTILKRVEGAVLLENDKGVKLIRYDNVRLSYAFIGTPSEDENDNGETVRKWRTNLLLPKTTHRAAVVLTKQLIEEIAAANDSKVPKDKWFYKDGDEGEDEVAQGHWIVTASEGKVRPSARNRRAELMDSIDEIDKTFYSGCYCNVLVRPWFFAGKTKNSAKTYPKRISAGLVGLQLVDAGTPLGNGKIDDTDAWEVPDDAKSGKSSSDGMDDDDDL